MDKNIKKIKTQNFSYKSCLCHNFTVLNLFILRVLKGKNKILSCGFMGDTRERIIYYRSNLLCDFIEKRNFWS